MFLGENIRYLRTKKGYSQDYIAEKLGYKSFTTIQKWESGISEPPVKKLKELAELLDADMDDMNNIRLSTHVKKQPISNYNLSAIEQQIINHYRIADDVDKEIVHRILNITEKESQENLA